jgi:ubiquinone/menaquinone biosynthesis C-methylase UbiE
MRAMRFPDSSFSGVLALHSIIHFDYQSIVNAFREINRVLVPGGAFLLAFHIGNEIIVNREFLGESVTIELHLLEVGKIRELLTSTDFKILEVIERYPNPEIEYPSKRAYILAIKSN